MAWTRKKKIDRELLKEAWLRFDPDRFLTPSEKTLVEKRLLIAALLDKGVTYRAIGEMLDVTRVTISFVKHNLKRTPRTHLASGFSKPRKNEDDASLFMSPGEHIRRARRKVGL
jgi:Trp operon repressor